MQLLGVGGGKKKADQENENAGVSEIRSFCSRGHSIDIGTVSSVVYFADSV